MSAASRNAEGSPLRRRTRDAGRGPPTAPDYSPLVPPDYLVQVGDEVAITIWGAVECRPARDRRSLRPHQPAARRLDHAGRRALRRSAADHQQPRGAKSSRISSSASRSASCAACVSTSPASWSTPAPSPSARCRRSPPPCCARAARREAGSLRNIELRRGGSVVSRLDLYDLLLNGNRGADRLVQPGDVIHVAAIGPQVAVIGSVNQPAVFELKPTETIADVLKMAGGFAAVADTTRLTLERLDDRATVRITQTSIAGQRRRHAAQCRRAARLQRRRFTAAHGAPEQAHPRRRRSRAPGRLRAAAGQHAGRRPARRRGPDRQCLSCTAPSSAARACAHSSSRTTNAPCATWRPISRAPARRNVSRRPTTPPSRPRAHNDDPAHRTPARREAHRPRRAAAHIPTA